MRHLWFYFLFYGVGAYWKVVYGLVVGAPIGFSFTQKAGEMKSGELPEHPFDLASLKSYGMITRYVICVENTVLGIEHIILDFCIQ